jgi:hypothetical protein
MPSRASEGTPSVPSGSRTRGTFFSYIGWTKTRVGTQRRRAASAGRRTCSWGATFVQAKPYVKESSENESWRNRIAVLTHSGMLHFGCDGRRPGVGGWLLVGYGHPRHAVISRAMTEPGGGS